MYTYFLLNMVILNSRDQPAELRILDFLHFEQTLKQAYT